MRTTTKRIVCLLLMAGFMILSVCACGQEKEELSKRKTEAEKVEEAVKTVEEAEHAETVEALENQEKGMNLEENAKWIEENKNKLHHWFFSTDLTSFIRGGRISKVSGFFGQALNICPLMNVNSEGKLIPREKIRGKKRVMGQMLKQMELHAQSGTAYKGKCFICHSDCLADAKELASMVEAAFPGLNGPVRIFPIGTVIGSHTGPGTVALFFWGDERTL